MAVVRAGEAAGKSHLTGTADDSVQKRLTILIREAEMCIRDSTNAVLDVLGCVFLGIKTMGWTQMCIRDRCAVRRF